MFRLRFLQLEDGAVEALLECVVEEPPHWHFLVLVGVFHELKKFFEHLCVVATVKNLLVLLLLFLRSRFHVGVEIDFFLEKLVRLVEVLILEELYLPELRVVPEHLGEGSSASIRPQVLRVGCLLHGDFLKGIVGLE